MWWDVDIWKSLDVLESRSFWRNTPRSTLTTSPRFVCQSSWPTRCRLLGRCHTSAAVFCCLMMFNGVNRVLIKFRSSRFSNAWTIDFYQIHGVLSRQPCNKETGVLVSSQFLQENCTKSWTQCRSLPCLPISDGTAVGLFAEVLLQRVRRWSYLRLYHGGREAGFWMVLVGFCLKQETCH